MARLNINHLDEQVTFTPNKPGIISTVFAIKVPEKVVYTIFDGAVLVMKLRDAEGKEIDPTSEIVFAGIRPGRRLPVEIDGKDYRAWASLPLNDQYDNNKNAAIRLEIARGRLDLLETHQFLIQVNSPDIVDLDNSLFELEVDYAPYRDR